MAQVSSAKVEEFLAVGSGFGFGSDSSSGSGDGYGSGSGDGYGDGYGSGSGDGDSYGYGSGSGSGDGSGDGDGYGEGRGSGISIFCGQPVHRIDGVQTILLHIHGSIAKGMILYGDLTTENCYVCKQGDVFAHGATLREAMDALNEKLFEDLSEEERVQQFVESFELDKAYPNRTFFNWHHKLTGSCEQGRKAFVKDKGLEIDSGETTTRDFILLTMNAGFGDSTMRKVANAYGLEEQGCLTESKLPSSRKSRKPPTARR